MWKLIKQKSFKISSIGKEIFFPGLNFKYFYDKSLWNNLFQLTNQIQYGSPFCCAFFDNFESAKTCWHFQIGQYNHFLQFSNWPRITFSVFDSVKTKCSIGFLSSKKVRNFDFFKVFLLLLFRCKQKFNFNVEILNWHPKKWKWLRQQFWAN